LLPARPASRPHPADAPGPATNGALPQLTVRTAASFEEVGLDERTWNDLVAASETNTIFQTYQWVRSWLETLGSAVEPRFVVVSEGTRVVGIAPLCIERRRFGSDVVRFMGDTRADYCDVIAGPRKAEILALVFAEITKGADWDVLDLVSVPGASRTVDILGAVSRDTGFRALASPQASCFTMLITGHERAADDLRQRASVRRRYNMLRRRGRLVFRDLTCEREIAPYLDAFFEQHIARWRDTDSASLFLDGPNMAFYRRLTKRLSPSGWLLFSVVELDDKPVAFHYGFNYGGSLIWYKPAFDVAYAKQSPGLVLLDHLIGYAVDHRLHELDFTLGDEPFKRRFTNHVRRNCRIRIFRGALTHAAAVSRQQMSRIRRLSAHQ
jgi:CelD/BcsL family acetyltransferase involved in cellulose biosynthesis